jgi:transposase
MAYTSDITQAQYELLEPIFPKRLQTRPPIWTKHQILNGIFYQLKNGCKWVDLPKDFPPSGTVFYWFNSWKKDGVWEEILQTLWSLSRNSRGKKDDTYSTNS